MGREAWIQALRPDHYERWQKARNYAIYQAVKQGGRGTRERIAKAHNISRQRVQEIVELTERRIENGDYDDFQASKLLSPWELGEKKRRAKSLQQEAELPKDLD